MAINDLYEMMSSIANANYFSRNNPSGVVGMYPQNGLTVSTPLKNPTYISDDSSKRWFLMGISVWGADSEGNSDIVGE